MLGDNNLLTGERMILAIKDPQGLNVGQFTKTAQVLNLHESDAEDAKQREFFAERHMKAPYCWHRQQNNHDVSYQVENDNSQEY
jgi:hypothetical protein